MTFARQLSYDSGEVCDLFSKSSGVCVANCRLIRPICKRGDSAVLLSSIRLYRRCPDEVCSIAHNSVVAV